MGTLSTVILILLVWPAFALAGYQEPIDVIRDATGKVLTELSSAPDIRTNPIKLNLVIEQHILPHVDFPALSRLTLGKHWRKATPEQRAQFSREFRTLLVRTYSTSLTEYTDQRVEYTGSNTSPDNKRATVRTRIVEEGRPAISIDYSLRQVNDDWKIYDVSIEGVSLAVNYRATFAHEIRTHGLEGLIQHLAARNASVGGDTAVRLLQETLTDQERFIREAAAEYLVERSIQGQ